ncbi:MAG: hypothetical protein PPFGHCPK_01445 (plasmid) [Spiroplasma endosymbiont of Drosophila atripex]|nr:MAG: hypothetical protein PPFGHCPK_01445 [Spiroplasma endosymbiont of Drosophila atripex]
MKEQIHIWIETEVKEQLQKYCLENETTISQLTRKFWKDLLKIESK